MVFELVTRNVVKRSVPAWAWVCMLDEDNAIKSTQKHPIRISLIFSISSPVMKKEFLVVK